MTNYIKHIKNMLIISDPLTQIHELNHEVGFQDFIIRTEPTTKKPNQTKPNQIDQTRPAMHDRFFGSTEFFGQH